MEASPRLKNTKHRGHSAFMALFSKYSAKLLEVGIDNRISIDGMRIPSF
jgi:hypothetical protein